MLKYWSSLGGIALCVIPIPKLSEFFCVYLCDCVIECKSKEDTSGFCCHQNRNSGGAVGKGWVKSSW